MTIRDVAKLAGVAPSTVSKVLNESNAASDDVKQRVRSAAEELGYRPNDVARTLRSRSKRTIGLITNDIEGVFSAAMLRGVDEVASESGFSILLCNSFDHPDREHELIQLLLDKQVGGILLMNSRVQRVHTDRKLPRPVPLVLLYHCEESQHHPCVIPDDFAGAYAATAHLIARGRERIALVNGPLDFDATFARHQGYERAHHDHGAIVDPALHVRGEWTERSGYGLTQMLMAHPNPPDALFCSSDAIATGAYLALAELGIRIPQDIEVIGFDDQRCAAYLVPSLTTVKLPLVEMGRLAASLLIDEITTGRSHAGQHLSPCPLVIRESSPLSPRVASVHTT